MKKNIVFIKNLESNPNNNYSLKNWEIWCKKNNCDIFTLNDKIYEDSSFDKFLVFDLLENENIPYKQILITNTDTLIHPNAPNIFTQTENKLCGVFYNSSYNWLFKSIENYSKYMFSNFTFPYWEYIDTGVIIVNETHKKIFSQISEFYMNNKENIKQMLNSFNVGTDNPIFNFFIHKNKVKLKVLPYEWNMQDMSRKEVINSNLVFTKIGWIYQFNLLQNKNYWVETTYKHLKNND